jgi:hypothetical protein
LIKRTVVEVEAILALWVSRLPSLVASLKVQSSQLYALQHTRHEYYIHPGVTIGFRALAMFSAKLQLGSQQIGLQLRVSYNVHLRVSYGAKLTLDDAEAILIAGSRAS